jgi:hypothetical protein
MTKYRLMMISTSDKSDRWNNYDKSDRWDVNTIIIITRQ